MQKIVVGLSGGVDSAVCAAMLKEAGWEVHGLFLDFGLGSAADAAQVARDLGIAFHTAGEKEELETHVCQYFAAEYARGRTPNPCIVCNPKVKFKTICDFAREIGASAIATGHYARTERDKKGRPLLRMAACPKDQSYMLYRLPRAVVGQLVLPLGDFSGKEAVRQKAAEMGIAIASKPDSMDICFVPDGDYTRWLEQRGVRLPQGNFVDGNGKVLGRHKGIHHYTVGQRKGLGVSASGRLFVREIRPETNEVVLSLEDVFATEILVDGVHFIMEELAAAPFQAEIKVRYSKSGVRGTVYPAGSSAKVVLEKPARAPAAGQSAVFYQGEYVIGGGFIR